MKLRNILFIIISFFLVSMISNLYFNIKINVLSIQLEEVKNEILELEIEKSKTFEHHVDKFSISNIEKLSRENNFKRLDVRNKKFDLVRPYKLSEDSKPIFVLGYGK